MQFSSKKNCLDLLREKYKVTPMPVSHIEGFQVNPFLPTMEEKYSRLVHAKTYFNDHLNHPTEEELERYLSKHLHLIEPGMRLIQTQYEVEGGRVDILAKDCKDNICVIELKVTDNDPTLIWQSIYYPFAVQQHFKDKQIRMLTVTPKLAKHIYIPLRQVANIEMFTYKARMSRKKIKQLVITKEPFQLAERAFMAN